MAGLHVDVNVDRIRTGPGNPSRPLTMPRNNFGDKFDFTHIPHSVEAFRTTRMPHQRILTVIVCPIYYAACSRPQWSHFIMECLEGWGELKILERPSQ